MARLLLCFSLLLLVACGASSPRIDSPEATDWESRVLGGPPDARLVVRLDKAKADPVYGGAPTAYDRPVDPETEALVRDLDSLELWFVADDGRASRASFLVVVRGRPNLDTLRRHGDTRALFARKPERLPSGVLAFDFSDEETPLGFFVLPSGTWVIAAGRIVGRVRYQLFSHAEEPPPAPHERDAIVALWIGPGATRLSGVAKHADGFEELSLSVRSSQRGDMELSVQFADDKSAKRALAAADTLLAQLPGAQKALTDRCPAWSEVRIGLERRSRSLTGRLSNLPALVRAYRSGACKYERRGR